MRMIGKILKGIVTFLTGVAVLLLFIGGMGDIESSVTVERLVAFIALPGALCSVLALTVLWTSKSRPACLGLFMGSTALAVLAFAIHPKWDLWYYDGEAMMSALMYMFSVLVTLPALIASAVYLWLDRQVEKRDSPSE